MEVQSDDVALAIKYRDQLSRAIGQGLSADDVRHASEFVADAQPADIYNKHTDIPFVYEVLFKPGWEQKVSALVDRWVESAENVKRASTHVGRAASKYGPGLVRAFCMFRLKSFPSLGWIPVSEGLSLDDGEHQTVVFIALSDLGPSNGFFMPLKKGEDVCMDGNAILKFPPSDGGFGIFICLNL